MSMCLYFTGTTLVLSYIFAGTVSTIGTLVSATLVFCTNILLALHWYYSYMYWYCGYCWYIGTSHSPLVPATLCQCIYMLLVPHWHKSLYFLVPICYWYCTGTGLYMYRYCGNCWYISTSHSMSLCLYVTGTTLVLLFICTGTLGTGGTQVPATLFFCTNMLLVLHLYCSLYVLVLWVL